MSHVNYAIMRSLQNVKRQFDLQRAQLIDRLTQMKL
jgi:hypothetical protein